MNKNHIKSLEENFVSAVVYIRNNAGDIPHFISTLNEVLKTNFKHYEIICVNDASDDGSVTVLKEIAKSASISSLSILNMSFYHGPEQTLNAGTDLAIGDLVFEFDSTTMDYDKDLIIQCYDKILTGYDLVSACPQCQTNKSSKLFYSIFNRYSNVPQNLTTESFRLMSRRMINRVKAITNGTPYRKASYANCGLKQTSISYESQNNLTKCSLASPPLDFRQSLAADALLLYTDVAWKVALTVAGVMILTAIFSALYAAIFFISGQNPVPGWTTAMILSSFSFFGVFAILAVIIKYLSLIVTLTFKQKMYIVESLEKMSCE